MNSLAIRLSGSLLKRSDWMGQPFACCICFTSQQQKVGKQHQLPGQRLPDRDHARVPSPTAQVFSCRVKADACAVRDAQSGD